MEFHVDWSDLAKESLNNLILYYLDVAGVTVADKNLTTIINSVDTLDTYPYRCKSGRVSGTFEHIIAGVPCIAVFSVEANVVQVLEILHTARLYP